MSRLIDEHRGHFGVEPICRVLGVSASAYYQRATGERSARAVGRDRVKRLMRAEGIEGAKRRGKLWRTTRPDPDPSGMHSQSIAL